MHNGKNFVTIHNIQSKSMKKVLLALGLLSGIFSVTSLNAQEQDVYYSLDSKKWKFGAYLAPTVSWMRPTANKSDDGKFNTSNDGSKVGFTYGLMADYRFAPNYSVVTGLQINMAGGHIIADAVDQSYNPDTRNVLKSDFDYKLQYLEVPVALKMRTNAVSGIRFFGQLGINTSINIAKKTTFEVLMNENGTAQTYSDDNIKLKGLSVSPVLFSMSIGAGLEYPINDDLSGYFGIFFNNGFAPDVTNPKRYTLPYNSEFFDGNIRLNNFAFRFGLLF